MQSWFSQIVIGIIVTVVGTVIANALVGGSHRSRHLVPFHFASGANNARH